MLSDSFYYTVASILDRSASGGDSWKKLCSSSNISKPGLIYGCVGEVLKFKKSLTEIAEKASVFSGKPRSASKSLILVLLYELLILRKFRGTETMRQLVDKDRTRLFAELARFKVRNGLVNDQELAEGGGREGPPRKRFLRVNTLQCTLSEAEKHLVSAGFQNRSPDEKKFFFLDAHIPNLFCLSGDASFADDPYYVQGKLIIQNKSSCFPAFILNPPEGATVFDTCAAPGNKTTHLAMLMNGRGKIFAFEKDADRFKTLQKLTSLAVPSPGMIDCIWADFLSIDPLDRSFSSVTHALIDPSCSGSGILSREDDPQSISKERLQSLVSFQVKIVLHAMKFPSIQKISYSTCSIHEEENEQVVARVLAENHEFHLIPAFPGWERRGLGKFSNCIRIDHLKDDGVGGFFVALLERASG